MKKTISAYIYISYNFLPATLITQTRHYSNVPLTLKLKYQSSIKNLATPFLNTI